MFLFPAKREAKAKPVPAPRMPKADELACPIAAPPSLRILSATPA